MLDIVSVKTEPEEEEKKREVRTERSNGRSRTRVGRVDKGRLVINVVSIQGK